MSIIDNSNKIKLLFGEFTITSVVQDGGGNKILVSGLEYEDSLGVSSGDYVYSASNSNLNGVVKVTAVGAWSSVDKNQLVTVNYAGGSGTVTGGVLSIGKKISVLFADDESFEIIAKPKQRLAQWSAIENIAGYRKIISIKTEALSDSQRKFLYRLSISETQYCVVNSVFYSVYLSNDNLSAELIHGYFSAISFSIEFKTKTYTRALSTSFSGDTNSYGYYAGSPTGTRVNLSFSYGGSNVSRNFVVNLVNVYGLDIQKKSWEYIDWSEGRKTFGIKSTVIIDFGTFGFSQTESQMQDDRDFIKDFVLAPSKRITAYGLYVVDVVNDFTDVKYSYLEDFIYGKTIVLSFKGKSIQTNLVEDNSSFVLDDNSLGILNENILG